MYGRGCSWSAVIAVVVMTSAVSAVSAQPRPVQLRISAPRSVNVGQTCRVIARTASLPRTTVVLQKRVEGRWRTVATRRPTRGSATLRCGSSPVGASLRYRALLRRAGRTVARSATVTIRVTAPPGVVGPPVIPIVPPTAGLAVPGAVAPDGAVAGPGGAIGGPETADSSPGLALPDPRPAIGPDSDQPSLPDRLTEGQQLLTGQELRSPSGQYRLVMQDDGNLVQYTIGGRALWHANTHGNPGARAVLQGDGNFVVYAAGGAALWNSGTGGSDSDRLVVQDDGNVVLYGAAARWASGNLPSRIERGEHLLAGHYLGSPSGLYRLVMQHDGNLVLYVGARALWNTQTSGHPGARVEMQHDGNLVVYSASGPALWDSRTGGSAAVRFEVQDDANLVLYGGGGAVWDAAVSNPRLLNGERLDVGQALWSTSRRFVLAMQTDGNLALYDNGVARWHAGTNGHPGAYVVLQGDGNLVVYSPSGPALWDSRTGGSGANEAVIQDDGNFVIYRPGAAVWNTNTVAGAPGTPAPRPAVDDYPADCANVSGENCRTAPKDTYVDRWAFYSRECTSFVAWRMNRDHGAGAFHNTMRGGRWGHAYMWDDNARALGYHVTATPRVGAIAQWNGGEPGASSYGHVAYVSEVRTDGTVIVEDYNSDNRGFYARRGPLRAPRYIYFP